MNLWTIFANECNDYSCEFNKNSLASELVSITFKLPLKIVFL